MYEHDLKNLGFSEKEAKIYEAALELGEATPNDIAKKSGVARGTTYFILEEFMKMGLATSAEKGKKLFFALTSPDNLHRLIEGEKKKIGEKEEILEKILPSLKNLLETAGEKPKVRFFEGKKGLEAIKDEFLKTKDKQIEGIVSQDDVDKIFTPEEAANYFNRRVKKGIRFKGIYTRDKGPFENIAKIDELRIIPKDKFPLSVDITIYSDKVAISSLKGKLIGVIIESNAIAETFKSIFNLSWEAAEKYQK